MKTIIVSYKNPDMDGTAAMFALKELHEKVGNKNVGYFIDANPQFEVELVLKKYAIDLESEVKISSNDKFVLVDCNDLSKVDNAVTPNNIIEVIDHHEINEDAKHFINAKLDVQKVGAMATLVVERFIEQGIAPSLESAILLYHAIASNTINLKGDVTTSRDLQAFDYLGNLYSKILSPKNIADIFSQKSKIDNIEKTILSDLKTITLENNLVVIGQLEIVNVSEFCNKNLAELKRIMKIISKEYQTENVMLNIIDIVNGCNFILCPSQGFLKNKLITSLGLNFSDNIAKIDKIVMRKQIIATLSKI